MRYPVTLDARHLQGLSRPLLSGVIELIWNAIDADSRTITVALRDNGLSGVGEVEIVDDGHGINLATARDAFLTLGRSWKAGGARSKVLGRPLHGKDGRGRFSVFRHGGTAVWDSVSQLGGRHAHVRITIRNGDSSIEIEDLGEVDGPVGTRVLLRDFGTPPQGLLGELPHDRLISQFAVPIDDHGLRLTYNRQPVDPRDVLEDRYELEVPDRPGPPLGMTVIEWSRAIGRQDLYVCDERGATLERIPSRVPALRAHFTAYLRWNGFADQTASLAVADLDGGDLGRVVGVARRRLAQHFADLYAQRQRRVIADWKREGVYPFTGRAADEQERAARDTFDVVSLETAKTVNASSKPSKRLALRLLREALESKPGHIHKVLGEVLDLSRERLAELAALLERTKLASMISASRSIADRLDFLEALAKLTCTPEISADVLERDHLHRILEGETWVFGEEYALTTSEAGLTQVLERHVRLLGREYLSGAPVRDSGGRPRRVDLMLAATVPHGDDIREHLIIELKRPTVAIGPSELQQVKEYALAVADESRFDASRTRWEFWSLDGRHWHR
jgi:hypothetical protein